MAVGARVIVGPAEETIRPVAPIRASRSPAPTVAGSGRIHQPGKHPLGLLGGVWRKSEVLIFVARVDAKRFLEGVKRSHETHTNQEIAPSVLEDVREVPFPESTTAGKGADSDVSFDVFLMGLFSAGFRALNHLLQQVLGDGELQIDRVVIG